MSDSAPNDSNKALAIPAGFGTENEHPMLSMPFSVVLGNQVFAGKRISVTHIRGFCHHHGGRRHGLGQ